MTSPTSGHDPGRRLALRVKAKGGNQAVLDQPGMGDCKVDVPLLFIRREGVTSGATVCLHKLLWG
jgi:hypothetical protein